MPALAPRQSRAGEASNTLSPLRIAGIVIVIVVILVFTGVYIWRRRRGKKREAERSWRSRRFIKSAFPRSAPDSTLPAYEPPRQDFELQRGASGGSDAVTWLQTPSPARLPTPPGYGAHVMDRPAGPLSDSPPAYQERDRQTWGRSGCIR